MSVNTLHTEYIIKHQYFTARRDRYQLESGKIVDPYFVVELPRGAAAMAITEDGKVIMVRQYRHPINEVLLELPGGFIDNDENAEIAIRRELDEETGFTFSNVHLLGKTLLNPGVLNNVTYMFLAWGGKKTAEQKLDANEEIEIAFKPLNEVKQMLLNYEIKQSMHALCLFYGFNYLEANGIG